MFQIATAFDPYRGDPFQFLLWRVNPFEGTEHCEDPFRVNHSCSLIETILLTIMPELFSHIL